MINAKIKCPYCQAVNPVDYNHKRCGCIICAMLLGSFGVDYFIYGKVLRGLVNILLCWTGGPFVLGIFRGFEIMALEPDQLQDYYDKKARF